ncbi:helix-turn-helix domain-containing protein [Georgenia faecalis]|uniref:Helix-turn-helix domain-containing protein n=1 Tax=Georgenia faecalis TaxID=2483799 RepID=A0ABV9DCE4_9MICO
MTEKIARGTRVVGERRSALAASVAERYQQGESVRSIAADIGRSYGFVHGLLVSEQVTMRRRGGPLRRDAAPAVPL